MSCCLSVRRIGREEARVWETAQRDDDERVFKDCIDYHYPFLPSILNLNECPLPFINTQAQLASIHGLMHKSLFKDH